MKISLLIGLISYRKTHRTQFCPAATIAEQRLPLTLKIFRGKILTSQFARYLMLELITWTFALVLLPLNIRQWKKYGYALYPFVGEKLYEIEEFLSSRSKIFASSCRFLKIFFGNYHEVSRGITLFEIFALIFVCICAVAIDLFSVTAVNPLPGFLVTLIAMNFMSIILHHKWVYLKFYILCGKKRTGTHPALSHLKSTD